MIRELLRVSWSLAMVHASLRLSECSVISLSERCDRLVSLERLTSLCIADLASAKSLSIVSRKACECSGGVMESHMRVRSLSIDLGISSQFLLAWSKRAP